MDQCHHFNPFSNQSINPTLEDRRFCETKYQNDNDIDKLFHSKFWSKSKRIYLFSIIVLLRLKIRMKNLNHSIFKIKAFSRFNSTMIEWKAMIDSYKWTIIIDHEQRWRINRKLLIEFQSDSKTEQKQRDRIASFRLLWLIDWLRFEWSKSIMESLYDSFSSVLLPPPPQSSNNRKNSKSWFQFNWNQLKRSKKFDCN